MLSTVSIIIQDRTNVNFSFNKHDKCYILCFFFTSDTSQSTFSTIVYDEGRNSVLNATNDWETNATQITEGDEHICF